MRRRIDRQQLHAETIEMNGRGRPKACERVKLFEVAPLQTAETTVII
jgi:hypothetical protein